ncbi:hypothetical protein J3R83DRAFT_4658 [Lanmaoa asiatica]|nr:hypothetical protein J3R83DRAFT_4658 [Lanmaoa asiatica]
MSNIRLADLSSVKHKGLKYFPQNMFSRSDALDPPIPEVADKSMRGIFHPQLARFLCPARKLDRFDDNPELYNFFLAVMAEHYLLYHHI